MSGCRKHAGQYGEENRLAVRRSGGITVVHEQNVAGRQIVKQTLSYPLRIWFARVESAFCPGHQSQIEVLQHRFQKDIAQPGRRAKEYRAFAGEFGQRPLCRLHFPGQRARCFNRKRVPVRLGMVFDRVTARHDLADERRITAGALADAEKGCANAVVIKQVEHPRRDNGVRTVIDRQRDAVSVAGDCR
jgi:hypothetical protein